MIKAGEPRPLSSGFGESESEGAEEPVVIVCMSGDFTQRGEPALLDKWTRSEMALESGADLVVEMPTVFAVNNSRYFAEGGVEILEALGADYISFGSETADLERLRDAASRRDRMDENDESRIRDLVKKGYSYPRALTEVLGEEDIVPGPNDNLAIEYLRHMTKAEPLLIERKGPGYGSEGRIEGLASASYIRRLLLTGRDVKDLVPVKSLLLIRKFQKECGFCTKDLFWPILQAKIASADETDLNRIYGAEEGLGSKMKEEFRYCASYDELIDSLKSKRYTRTRIQRVILDTLLDIKTENVRNAKNYIRILALNDRGAAHLKLIKKQGCPLPIVTNINKSIKEYPELEESLLLDVLAVDLYNTALKRDLYLNSEYVKKPLKYEGK